MFGSTLAVIVAVAAIVVLISLAALGWLAYTAPFGYEDDDGFHLEQD